MSKDDDQGKNEQNNGQGRRDFLKAGAAAAGAGIAASIVPGSAAAAVENAKGVDILIHEIAPTVERYSQATGLPKELAKIVVANSHTPAKALDNNCQI